MKEVFAISAIMGKLTACNNEKKTGETKMDEKMDEKKDGMRIIWIK